MSKLAAFDAARRKSALEHLSSFRRSIDLPSLSERNQQFCSDETLLRYLVASGSDEKVALAKLQETLAWRSDVVYSAKQRSNLPVCSACEHDAHSHCFHRLGEDVHGRHVTYACPARATNKVIEDNCNHMAFEVERIFDGNKAPGKMVWLIDFNGFGVRDMDPRMARFALPMFEKHYPERMSQIVAMDPPRLFNMFYRTIAPAIDPVTREKLIFVRSGAELQKYADEMWSNDPALKSWVEAVVRLPAQPGSYPSESLNRQLIDSSTRDFLRRSTLGNNSVANGRSETFKERTAEAVDDPGDGEDYWSCGSEEGLVEDLSASTLGVRSVPDEEFFERAAGYAAKAADKVRQRSRCCLCPCRQRQQAL
eukprot:TRINITY_DN9091_c0_g1_i1.p1 TRINITY_DN9091_c0_g1~~TRINITY_DN9091_c0_g1_i1.p1  ORF type:complete len:366 (+),score=48.75 TRINITY_DN9091_c0_g1_i1:63-1160(+)